MRPRGIAINGTDDPVEQFRAALAARSIVQPKRIIADGEIHRCEAEGKNGEGDAAYLLHIDGFAAGGFQNWRDGIGWENWRADIGRELTWAEQERRRAVAAATRAKQEAETIKRQAEAAAVAGKIWSEAEEAVEHPYLSRKGVAAHGARLSRGDLVLPLRDAGGVLRNLQFIKLDGTKRYLFGGQVSGCYFPIGTPGDVILIGTGFATSVSGHEATGYPVAVAFSDSNLRAVAEVLRSELPNVRIVILADDDHRKVGNPGITKARKAAVAVGGATAIPEFGPDRPEKATDFNDMTQISGGPAAQVVIEGAVKAAGEGATKPKVSPLNRDSAPTAWGEPDMGVLRLHRRTPPPLPLDVFGPAWGPWIVSAADAAACPPDYVAAPLLASTSALIGNSRWAQATPGWAEPPHLWVGGAGDSGDGKSPGADCLMRDVLPAIERRMLADFPDRLREWRARVELTKAGDERWKSEVRDAQKRGAPPPLPPADVDEAEPQAPRLRQSDVTIERVATLLAAAAPKGLLIVRDELAGWFDGMNSYNDAGRAFWIEAYGGRPYRVERQKHPEPIEIPRLAVAVSGGTQPDKLAILMRAADDGLLSRMLWVWPEPVPFRLGQKPPGVQWAINALDRLRELDLQPTDPPSPVMVRLADEALPLIEEFGRDMQMRKTAAGGLLRSALGKARGLALRLALNLEMLWWCGTQGMEPPPARISVRAFAAAARLVVDYFLPMAERVYGDAAATPEDRNAATLARWIIRDHPAELHVRHVQRIVRLSGLKIADDIHAAAAVLRDADWLAPPSAGAGYAAGRPRAIYRINPRVWELGQ